MKGLQILLTKIWYVMTNFRAWIPGSMAGIFIINNFISDYANSGFAFALQQLMKTVVVAEKVISENVTLAVQNSVDYGLYEFFEILISFYILWRFLKVFREFARKTQNANEGYGEWWMAALFLFILEYCGVLLLTISDYYVSGAIDYNNLKFIPLFSGVFYLLINLGPVLNNIHFWGYTAKEIAVKFGWKQTVEIIKNDTTTSAINKLNETVSKTVENITNNYIIK